MAVKAEVKHKRSRVKIGLIVMVFGCTRYLEVNLTSMAFNGNLLSRRDKECLKIETTVRVSELDKSQRILPISPNINLSLELATDGNTLRRDPFLVRLAPQLR